MLLDNCHGHDVENRTNIDIFLIGEFIIASAFRISGLNIPIDLILERPFQKDRIFLMCVDGGTDGGVIDLFFSLFLDVKRLLVCNVKFRGNLCDHILHRNFLWRRSSDFLAFAGLESSKRHLAFSSDAYSLRPYCCCSFS